jgi:membrane-associated phospholipid phosphatase
MSSTTNTAMTYGRAVRLYPFDWLILGYSSLMIMFITLLGQPPLALNLGLAIGTVWGRFHYVSDVVAGGFLGPVSVLVVREHYPGWSRSAVVLYT